MPGLVLYTPVLHVHVQLKVYGTVKTSLMSHVVYVQLYILLHHRIRVHVQHSSTSPATVQVWYRYRDLYLYCTARKKNYFSFWAVPLPQ